MYILWNCCEICTTLFSWPHRCNMSVPSVDFIHYCTWFSMEKSPLVSISVTRSEAQKHVFTVKCVNIGCSGYLYLVRIKELGNFNNKITKLAIKHCTWVHVCLLTCDVWGRSLQSSNIKFYSNSIFLKHFFSSY